YEIRAWRLIIPTRHTRGFDPVTPLICAGFAHVDDPTGPAFVCRDAKFCVSTDESLFLSKPCVFSRSTSLEPPRPVSSLDYVPEKTVPPRLRIQTDGRPACGD